MRPVDRQVLHPGVAPEAEQQPQDADQEAGEQDLMPGEAEEVALIEVGEADVHLAAGAVLGATPAPAPGRRRATRPPGRRPPAGAAAT